MDANKTFQMIEKAFSDKRPVMVTDGTVTRRVVSVGLAEQLYIHTETGEWVEIKRSFCGLTLDGWGLLDTRSEERRVGKECRSRWSPYH